MGKEGCGAALDSSQATCCAPVYPRCCSSSRLRQRALGGDFSGISGTIDITIAGVIIMLAVTLILNFIALLRRDASR